MIRGDGVLTHPSCIHSFLRTIVKGIGGQGRTEVCPGRTIRRWSSADKWPLYLIIYAICMDAPRCVHISFLYLIIYADTCIDDAPGCVPTVCLPYPGWQACGRGKSALGGMRLLCLSVAAHELGNLYFLKFIICMLRGLTFLNSKLPGRHVSVGPFSDLSDRLGGSISWCVPILFSYISGFGTGVWDIDTVLPCGHYAIPDSSV